MKRKETAQKERTRNDLIVLVRVYDMNGSMTVTPLLLYDRMNSKQAHTHKHTHTHTLMYTYKYICIQRERERERKSDTREKIKHTRTYTRMHKGS
jgi:hypothetical protein